MFDFTFSEYWLDKVADKPIPSLAPLLDTLNSTEQIHVNKRILALFHKLLTNAMHLKHI